MKLRTNNNTKVVNHLAVNSVKSSKMRNFFIIFTIALSVSLLMAMSLSFSGIDTASKRKVADMQHVIYNNASDNQIEALAKDERVELLLLSKNGRGVELDNKLIQPVWFGAQAEKGDESVIDMGDVVTGKLPEAKNEIAVVQGFSEFMGVKEEIGTKVAIPFLDGTTEDFIVSGIMAGPKQTARYSIAFSEAYANDGNQLKDIPYQAIVRIHGAADMSQSEFLDVIRDIAAKSGIERKNVNENNIFLGTLSGGAVQGSENLVIAILGIGISFVSILVIYSVFYLSVISRIRQFGQLRTIGMSKKQIKKMITKEGLLLCAVGLPIGIIIGGAVGYLVQRQGWDWKNTFLITAVVIIADLLTVLISIYKPAKLASMISPMEAAKYSSQEGQEKVVETKRLHRKLTPLNLARMSASRNRKKTILTVISLGVGGVLFMAATTFVVSTSLEGYSRQGSLEYGEFVINLSYNIAATSDHGITDMQINNPLNEELEAKIKAIDGVENVLSFRKASIGWAANGETETGESVSGFAKGEVDDELLAEGTLDYDQMVKNNEIYIQRNELVEEIYGWKYALGDKVKLTFYNGRDEIEKEFTIGGILEKHQGVKNPLAGVFLMPEVSLNKLMDNMNLNAQMVVATDENKRNQVESQLNVVLDEYNMLTMDTLREQKAIDEESFSLIFAIIIGLSIFIIGFSIINLINTIITSIITRKQEFAMLQSMGMTNKQLNRMVQAEGILLAVGNFFITIIGGTAAGYTIIKLFNNMGIKYLHFTFPTIYFIGYTLFIVAVPVFVSAIVLYNLRKQTLVERLRVVD